MEPGSEKQTHEAAPTEAGAGDALAHETLPNVYKRATAYLLLRINEKIMQDEKDTLVGYLESDLSLEHIMPQTVDNAEGWSEVPREFHRALLHSFGNLTVVGGVYNIRIRNRPLHEKVLYYAKSNYGLTRQLAEEIRAADLYRDAAAGALDWDKLGKFFETRAQALADDAVKVLRF